jgi:hypothetical protein
MTNRCNVREFLGSLYLLSLLLTGSHEKAEACFVEGIGESTKENHVFKEWARSWARRTIIQSAIRLSLHGRASWHRFGLSMSRG